VSYWCPYGGVKYEPVATPFVVPSPPAGYEWTQLVLKATTNNVVVNDPIVGHAYTSGTFNLAGQEQAISHVILCKEQTPTTTSSTTTSTTTSTSSTTSSTTSTTTTTAPTTTSTTTTQPDETTSSTTEPAVTTTTTEAASTTTVVPQLVTTTTLVGQAGPTSTVEQSSGAATTTDPVGGQLPATGAGRDSASIVVIALTLIGIGAVMLRLASKPTR
jgi:LPXTG-motif cell wall-anchored protein